MARSGVQVGWVVAGLACIGIGIAAQADAALVSESRVRFVDVGQGACLIVRDSAGTVVVVDSGPSAGAEAVLDAFEQLGIDRVDLWLHTHYDADHIGGLSRIVLGADARADSLDDIEIGEAWDRGIEDIDDTVTARAYFATVGTRRRGVDPGDTWRRGAIDVKILVRPDSASKSRENQRGLAACLEVEGMRIFVPGDLDASTATEAARHCGRPDLAWVSHHGALDGTDAALIEALDAHAAVVTAGPSNVYCHPAPSVVEAWRTAVSVVYVTHLAATGAAEACAGPLDPAAAELQVVAGDLVFAPTHEGGRRIVSTPDNAVTLRAW